MPAAKPPKPKKKVRLKAFQLDPAPEEIVNIAKDLDQQKANVTMRKKQTKRQLATYLQATCLSPAASTFTKAINNNQFISWPGLTANLIAKHLPKSTCTYQGHMSTEKQGLQSTKLSPPHSNDDFFPEPVKPNIKSKEACYALYESNDAVGCMDLTGRFPKVSLSGNQCILVGCNCDGNCIDAIPTKNRKGPTITEA